MSQRYGRRPDVSPPVVWLCVALALCYGFLLGDSASPEVTVSIVRSCEDAPPQE